MSRETGVVLVKKIFNIAIWLIVVFPVWGYSQNDKSLSLSDAEFKKLHSTLEQKRDTWRSIPWRLNLLDAQNEAAKNKKMMVIWAMDGHPLGCT